MNLYYLCVYLSFAVAGTPYSEISPIFLHFFPDWRGFLFLASSAAVLFWHSLLSLDVFLVFPYFSRCCLLLHTTKLVYPFLLSNISGFSRVFSGCTGTSKELAEENAAGKSGGRGNSQPVITRDRRGGSNRWGAAQKEGHLRDLCQRVQRRSDSI